MKSVQAASELVETISKTAQAEIKISDFDLDLDKDGKVDAFEQKVKNALYAADTDNSGTLTPAEFVSVLKEMVESEKKRASLAKQVTGLSVLTVLLLVVLTVVSIVGAVVGGNSIKESHVSGLSVMTDKAGEPVGSAIAIEEHGLWDLPTLSLPVLGNFKELELYIDMTADADVAGWTVASTRPSTMYKKAATQLVMVTPEGYKISIDSAAKTGTIVMDGVTYPIADEPPPAAADSTRRKLAELMVPPEAAPPTLGRRRLRRGGLSTQGSFTMTAGSNDNLTGDGR